MDMPEISLSERRARVDAALDAYRTAAGVGKVSKRSCIIALFTDLKHYADASAVDFGVMLRIAESCYERSKAEKP